MKTDDVWKKLVIVMFAFWLMVFSAKNLHHARMQSYENSSNNITYDDVLIISKESDKEPTQIREIKEVTVAITASGLMNINMASKADFMSLEGIDEELAEHIIAYRDSRGGAFFKKEDMLKVPGMTEEIYEQIQDEITIRLK